MALHKQSIPGLSTKVNFHFSQLIHLVLFREPRALRMEVFDAKSNLSFCVCETKHFTLTVIFLFRRRSKDIMK